MPSIPDRASMPITVYQLIRSKRKTIALIVKPDASLIVRAPLRSSNKAITEFIEQNIKWVEKKQAEALALQPVKRKQYVAGETFLYLGKPYELEIVHDQKETLVLAGKFRLAESVQTQAAITFERWYRRQARQIITERVQLYANQFHFQYKQVRITGARTRWGSCSATGSLNFSWRLIMAPLEVVDYVVVHELAHTVVHNHSKRFWHRVGEIMPEYNAHRKWLREHGPKLLG